MTEEMKQEYLKKMSYEEWEAKVFEEIKNRFYLTKIDLSSMNYITFYFRENFKVAVSTLHFQYWYEKYSHARFPFVEITEAINNLEDIITKNWMEQIKK